MPQRLMPAIIRLPATKALRSNHELAHAAAHPTHTTMMALYHTLTECELAQLESYSFQQYLPCDEGFACTWPRHPQRLAG